MTAGPATGGAASGAHLPCAAVLFDVDGTLIDSTPLVEHAARLWAPEYGIDADEFLSGSHGRRTSDRVADFLPPDRVAEATARLDALEAEGTDGITALPGVLDLLANMNGLPWALVTSMDRGQLAARAAAARVPLPDVVITAEDVRHGKPDPSGYLQAAGRLGAEPSACVVIEDAPAGVAAGRAAGATVLAVTTSHPPETLGEAHRIIEDLTALTPAPDGLTLA
ncbi:HAD-IA family hydrolase [Actinomadura sp. LOL_016]|uniref:HAD-IA family hydrolase n=1 Tax=unclassified Actinomadura TaxID=2626254 RepID=UPI003A80045A